MEQGCWRGRPAERSIISDVGPDAPGIGLYLGQHRHGGVVAVEPFRGKDVCFDEQIKRLECGRTGADLISERRQADIDTFMGITVALAVERLMLSELLKQDHRQQTGAEQPARGDVKRRRRLRNTLASAAGEPFAHSLDDLPLAWDDFEGLGDIFAQLGQPVCAAARAAGRASNNDTLARQMLGQRLARWPGTDEGRDAGGPGSGDGGEALVFGRGGLRFLEAEFELIDQALAAFRPLAKALTLHLLDLKGQQRVAGDKIGVDGAGVGSLGFGKVRTRLRLRNRLAKLQNIAG